ncbi:DUF1223 domain-containing protein [Taibaiella soli]|uniref:DUF1223 domain-containing protein n=1 Tax=Taibaiella soli TaxID=1649169 RepID=A0A2W2ATD7_9BACT|nr:DUF1223 domain-containing protein [Taibaiella soli]PZF70968.1 DUF1223 domain-containing protein [Taibaiella soli]
MKQIKISRRSILIAIGLIAGAFISTSAMSCRTDVPANTGNGFAVLELFSSEGCSSCPPAEELLAQIAAGAGTKPVYVLAYHVDYWDRLGWKDAFSDAAFSQRQYDYNTHLGADVYTPQLVINGTTECIGSDKSAVHNGIDRALAASPTQTLTLKGNIGSHQMFVNYETSGNTDREELVLAVVQRHAISHVRAGENEGRTLSHAQIVRKLYHFNLKDGQSKVIVDLPTEFDPKSWEVIGWLQNGTGPIKAATRVILDN